MSYEKYDFFLINRTKFEHFQKKIPLSKIIIFGIEGKCHIPCKEIITQTDLANMLPKNAHTYLETPWPMLFEYIFSKYGRNIALISDDKNDLLGAKMNDIDVIS